MSKSIVLDPAQGASVARLVADGRYRSATDAVAAGIDLLLRREGRLAALRSAWRDGVDSGDYEPIETTSDERAERYAVRDNSRA